MELTPIPDLYGQPVALLEATNTTIHIRQHAGRFLLGFEDGRGTERYEAGAELSAFIEQALLAGDAAVRLCLLAAWRSHVAAYREATSRTTRKWRDAVASGRVNVEHGAVVMAHAGNSGFKVREGSLETPLCYVPDDNLQRAA